MQYFDFTYLINKYSTEFTAITLSEGYFDDAGDWVNGETVLTPLTGAIISRSESKVFRSEGALTEKDKRLFMLQPIDNKLHGAKIVYNQDAFDLLNCIENAQFTGVYAYTLKYISAFKDIAPNYDLTEDLERLEKRLDGTLIEEGEPEPDNSYAKAKESLEKRLGGENYD